MKDVNSGFTLGQKDIEKILSLSVPYTYNHHSQLFYEGQTPIVAYLVLEGEIHLTKNKRMRTKVIPGQILGLTELVEHKPLPFAAEALPKTKVVFLDISTVKEILSGQLPALKDVFENILQSA